MIIANKAREHIAKASRLLSHQAVASMSCKTPSTFILFNAAQETQSKIAYQEEISKHRMKLPLYDLYPRTENNWIAPNATVSEY